MQHILQPRKIMCVYGSECMKVSVRFLILVNILLVQTNAARAVGGG